MEIFKKPAPGEQIGSPQQIALEGYASAFDLAATPAIPLDYPVVEPSPAQTMAANLDNSVRLEGYDFNIDGPLHPGDSLRVTLVLAHASEHGHVLQSLRSVILW